MILLYILAIPVFLLLLIQYTMVISDWRNDRAETWEIVVGLIPLGPFLLMMLAGVWHLLRKTLK